MQSRGKVIVRGLEVQSRERVREIGLAGARDESVRSAYSISSPLAPTRLPSSKVNLYPCMQVLLAWLYGGGGVPAS